jgi:hypothetical protein
MQLLETELRERCSNAKFRMRKSGFSFVPTYDVDEAFSYLQKPLWKNVFGFFRDLLQGKFEQVLKEAMCTAEENLIPTIHLNGSIRCMKNTNSNRSGFF